MEESSKGIVAEILSSSRGGDGLWSVFWFVFFFLCRWGQSVGVGIATITPRSSGGNEGGDLLWYHPSSQWARYEGDRIYLLQWVLMWGSRGCLIVISFPTGWKLWYTRVSKDKISCMELIIVVRIDWRSQQSIQIHGVDQLSLLLECVILLKRSRQRLVI